MIDENGLSIEVWTNDEGNQVSTYYLTDNHDKPIRFKLDRKETSVRMSWFRRILSEAFG